MKVIYKSSSINASSPYAERELSLSEIDSKYQNGEISREEAISLSLNLIGNNKEVLIALAGSR